MRWLACDVMAALRCDGWHVMRWLACDAMAVTMAENVIATGVGRWTRGLAILCTWFRMYRSIVSYVSLHCFVCIAPLFRMYRSIVSYVSLHCCALLER